MINVNQITSQLARLPDAALQQYAAMHKNDPYTMALALAESNRRKQLRAGGQQNAPQQPTVADQTIAEMHQQAAPMPPQAQGQLPEEQGIGALPTPNMQKMADGGIVGYAAGGDTSSTLGRWFSSLLPESVSSQGVAMGADVPGYENTPERRALTGRLAELRGAFGMRQQTPAEQQEMADIQQKLTAHSQNPSVAIPTQSQAFPTSIAPQAIPGATPAAVPQGQFIDARTAIPGAAPGTKAPPRAAPSRAAVPGTAATPAPSSLEEIYKKMQGFGGDAETRKGLADLEKEEIATAASEKAAREAGRPKGEAYGKYEEALTKEGNAAEGKKAENLKMALINAGLAIAGGKSQYALQNIAEGAQVGTKQYQAGLDKLDEAAKAREKEMAMIEQARHAEARGDWKDNISYEHEANKARLDAKKFSLAGLAAINQTNKKETLDLYTEQLKLANADKIAREANAAHLKAYGMMAGNKQNPANIAVDNAAKDLDAWLKTDAGKDATPAQQEAKRLALLKQHFSMQGVAMPAMPGAAVDTTGFKVLRPN